MPPARGSAVLSSAEQKRLEDELAQVRNRAEAATAGTTATAGTDKPAGSTAGK
jgi:pyruvate/2-oxoacid:ferredoxin oxidoreductase alpha subunit